jgi:UDP-N-acetylmuramoyl-tripeptide--D-alanyl-D-alanine ligase
VSYGCYKADITGEPVSVPPYIHIKINLPGKNLNIRTNLTGTYNFDNVMASACIGNFFKVAPDRIVNAIENYKPENNRSQVIKKKGLTIVMDAYNANPTSMHAAIESFVSDFSGSKCLILGDMLELGTYAEQEHKKILRQIKKYSLKEVFLVGHNFSKVSKDYPYKSFANTENLCHFLNDNKLGDCTLLLKGSRGMKLEKILELL